MLKIKLIQPFIKNLRHCLLAIVLVGTVSACTPPPDNETRFHNGKYSFTIGDLDTAIRELQPLAESGHIDSQFYLAEIYAREEANPHYDFSQALLWYLKAAHREQPQAQYVLGRLFEYGAGLEADPTDALYWYRESANNGHGPAQFQLANLYLTGLYVRRDLEEAYVWATLSIDNLKGGDRTRATEFRESIAQRLTAPQINSSDQRASDRRSRN